MTKKELLNKIQSSTFKEHPSTRDIYKKYYRVIESLLHGLRDNIKIEYCDGTVPDSIATFPKDFDRFCRNKDATEIDKLLDNVNTELRTWKESLEKNKNDKDNKSKLIRWGLFAILVIVAIICFAISLSQEENKRLQNIFTLITAIMGSGVLGFGDININIDFKNSERGTKFSKRINWSILLICLAASIVLLILSSFGALEKWGLKGWIYWVLGIVIVLFTIISAVFLWTKSKANNDNNRDNNAENIEGVQK